jgi:hypothetical protein
MPDVTLLAFWIWSVFFWIRGCRESRRGDLLAAAALAALAVLTKFNGILILPLLAWIATLQLRRPGAWLVYLLLPCGALALCLALLARSYGAPFVAGLSQAATPEPGAVLAAPLVAALFTGGALLNHLPFLVACALRRLLAAAACMVVALLLLAFRSSTFRAATWLSAVSVPEGIVLSSAIAFLYGFALLAWLSLRLSFRDGPGRTGAMVAPWLWGVFAFSFLTAWTVNVRYLLPLVPAAALLVCDGVQSMRPRLASAGAAGLALLPGFLLSVGLVHADAELAAAQREGVRQVLARYPVAADRNLWFQGHWGFQWYMEQGGAQAVDLEALRLRRGDTLVIPANNSNTRRPDSRTTELVEEISVRLRTPLTMVSRAHAAGFHSSIWGLLPYSPWIPPAERFQVYRVR